MDIIGHEKQLIQIKESIKHKRLSHAHIVEGCDGIGKSMFAREVAHMILDIPSDKQAIDIDEITMQKGKKSIGVEEARNVITQINKKPFQGNQKVVIIHSSEKLTVQAQNAILKTIEEPPVGTYIILLCSNLESILDTIKSRCQVHRLMPLAKDDILVYMNKKYPHLKEEDKKVVQAFSDGIPGRVDKFIEDKTFNEIRNNILALIQQKAMNQKIIGNLDMLLKYKDSWDEVIGCMVSFFRDMIILKEVGKDFIINSDKSQQLIEISDMFSFKNISDMLEITRESKIQVERNLNFDIVIEVMLLKIQEV